MATCCIAVTPPKLAPAQRLSRSSRSPSPTSAGAAPQAATSQPSAVRPTPQQTCTRLDTPKAKSFAEVAKQTPVPLPHQRANQRMAAQQAEAPAASSQQQQMQEKGGWAARAEAERRRRQEVAARADAANPQHESAVRSAAQAAEVQESIVGTEPAAAEAAVKLTVAQAAEEPGRQDLAQPSADPSQQGKQGEEGAQVAAAASSHAPQLAVNASLAWQLQPEGASATEGAAPAAASAPNEAEAQAAVEAASLVSSQGNGIEAVAKPHEQTVKDLGLACQLQEEINPCVSGVLQCWTGALGKRRATHSLHVLHAASFLCMTHSPLG